MTRGQRTSFHSALSAQTMSSRPSSSAAAAAAAASSSTRGKPATGKQTFRLRAAPAALTADNKRFHVGKFIAGKLSNLSRNAKLIPPTKELPKDGKAAARLPPRQKQKSFLKPEEKKEEGTTSWRLEDAVGDQRISFTGTPETPRPDTTSKYMLFVMTKNAKGEQELSCLPVVDSFDFRPNTTHKTLTLEQAEQALKDRNKLSARWSMQEKQGKVNKLGAFISESGGASDVVSHTNLKLSSTGSDEPRDTEDGDASHVVAEEGGDAEKKKKKKSGGSRGGGDGDGDDEGGGGGGEDRESNVGGDFNEEFSDDDDASHERAELEEKEVDVDVNEPTVLIEGAAEKTLDSEGKKMSKLLGQDEEEEEDEFAEEEPTEEADDAKDLAAPDKKRPVKGGAGDGDESSDSDDSDEGEDDLSDLEFSDDEDDAEMRQAQPSPSSGSSGGSGKQEKGGAAAASSSSSGAAASAVKGKRRAGGEERSGTPPQKKRVKTEGAAKAQAAANANAARGKAGKAGGGGAAAAAAAAAASSAVGFVTDADIISAFGSSKPRMTTTELTTILNTRGLDLRTKEGKDTFVRVMKEVCLLTFDPATNSKMLRLKDPSSV